MASEAETLDARLDRLEAMLLGVMDQLERLTEQVGRAQRVQERALHRLGEAVDEVRAQLPRRPARLPPPVRLEPPVEEPS